jgi:hypothetical protein
MSIGQVNRVTNEDVKTTRLAYGVCPAIQLPCTFTLFLASLKVPVRPSLYSALDISSEKYARVLPEMIHLVQSTDMGIPCADRPNEFPAGFNALAPI